jgi:purine-cytosine permease-like protein
MEIYEAFLYLIGSVFVPLFGVMAAHYYLESRRAGEGRDPEGRQDAEGVRAAALGPWLAGFLTYHWINPTGPTWWVDLVTRTVRTPLWERFPWLGASVPSFVVAFVIALVLFRRSRGQAATSIGSHRPTSSLTKSMQVDRSS